MRTILNVFTIILTMSISQLALAEITAEEAARLLPDGDLTPFGGEKAGNADGTIPAWTGGYTTAPDASYVSGSPRPDPFANEKPLFSITSANLSEHKDKLDEAQQELFAKFPDYRIDVYPTHRTASAPQWYYDKIYKTAQTAKAITVDGENHLEAAGGGIPFPIPKTGDELLWDHAMRWRGESAIYRFNAYIVDTNGTATIATGATNESNFPNNFKNNTVENYNGEYWDVFQTVLEPPHRSGELLMVRDHVENGRRAWQYLVGQRRVRRAPNIAYDTPNFVNSGVDFLDQPFVWWGPWDHYDWKIVGKKEMYIPYNNNRFHLHSDDEVIGKNFMNPDHLRWELHRVYEVEGNLREGIRDVRSKRKLYFDEDTKIAVIGNTWDPQGKLWHTTVGIPWIVSELPCLCMEMFYTHDLLRGTYTTTLINNSKDMQYKVHEEPYPDTFFTSDTLVRKGIR